MNVNQQRDYDTERKGLQEKMLHLEEHRLPVISYFKRRGLEKKLSRLDEAEKTELIADYIDQISTHTPTLDTNGFHVQISGKPFIVAKSEKDDSDFGSVIKSTEYAMRSLDGTILLKCGKSCAYVGMVLNEASWTVKILDTKADVDVTLSTNGTFLDDSPEFYLDVLKSIKSVHGVVDPLDA